MWGKYFIILLLLKMRRLEHRDLATYKASKWQSCSLYAASLIVEPTLSITLLYYL